MVISLPSNYRPVSLTSVAFSKGLFMMLWWTIYNGNKLIITEHQHGFVPEKSCMTQRLQAVEDWAEALGSGNSIDVLYLDFRKASLMNVWWVNYHIQVYDVRGTLFDWIKVFLQGQRQWVSVNGAFPIYWVVYHKDWSLVHYFVQ